jgi:hypothetical protein
MTEKELRSRRNPSAEPPSRNGKTRNVRTPPQRLGSVGYVFGTPKVPKSGTK